MSRNKTIDYAVKEVIKLLVSVSVPKYPHSRPQQVPAEYIVVNAFTTNPGPMQTIVLNANYHVKNLSGGVPDNAKLSSKTQAILDILENYGTSTLLIDFDTQEVSAENDEHISNIRFSLKIINAI
jgi:hypothetical protein